MDLSFITAPISKFFNERVFGHLPSTLVGWIVGVLIETGTYWDSQQVVATIPEKYRFLVHLAAIIVIGIGSGWKKTAAPVVALLLAFGAFQAQAEEPRFGGCIGVTDTCAGPRVSAALMAISLRDGQATTGVNIGLGYGITWRTTQWYQTGFAAYVNLRSTATGQAPVVSLAGTFANYVNLGLGYQIGGGGEFRDSAVVYVGLGSDLGAPTTPATVK